MILTLATTGLAKIVFHFSIPLDITWDLFAFAVKLNMDQYFTFKIIAYS